MPRAQLLGRSQVLYSKTVQKYELTRGEGWEEGLEVIGLRLPMPILIEQGE